MKTTSSVKGLMASVLVAAAMPAAAQSKAPDGPPEVFTQVVSCRTIADDTERLACFDRAVGALAQAEESRELKVVSRDQVQRSRRSLFGFVTSGFGMFDGEDEAEEEKIKEIDATITSYSGDTGRYVFRLDDGSVWEQIDGAFLKRPAAGKPIKIRRTFIGNYMGSVDGGVGFKIRRRN
ncbi:hypothetical protein [Erythrobacter sp. R86502]|uniref:hypothetical protein n=1 Tax=Erythrobacter sp. R86502 TaxID=3093846 RepID=UPI0036D40E88